jgi:hypothetical protein
MASSPLILCFPYRFRILTVTWRASPPLSHASRPHLVVLKRPLSDEFLINVPFLDQPLLRAPRILSASILSFPGPPAEAVFHFQRMGSPRLVWTTVVRPFPEFVPPVLWPPPTSRESGPCRRGPFHYRGRREISPGKDVDFPPTYPPRLHPGVRAVLVFAPFRELARSGPPCMRFLVVGPGVFLQLPSDSTSRWTPSLLPTGPTAKPEADSHRPSQRPRRAHEMRIPALEAGILVQPLSIVWRWE